MVGKLLGGVIAFGGGLSSGSAATPHAPVINVAWRVWHAQGLDHVPARVSPDRNDGIIYDMLPDKTSASAYGHATCKGIEAQVAEQIHAGVVPGWAKPTQ